MAKQIIIRTFNFIGILLMVLTIILSVPLSIPHLFNYEIYHVTSESMEPTFPIGSAVFVKKSSVSELEIGDAIAYRLGTDTDQVMTHRIVEDHNDLGEFITKGDNNNAVDPEGVSYSRVIGKVTYCIPHYGTFAVFFTTEQGRALTVCGFALAIILWMIAGILKKTQSDVIQGRQQEQELGEERERTIDYTKKNRRFRWGAILILVVGILLIVVSAIMLFRIESSYKAGVDEYKDIEKYVQHIDESEEQRIKREQEEIVEAYNGDKIHTPYWYDMDAIVDFENLQAINTDVVGWLFVGQAKVSYPVMHRDNAYYLDHTFTGTENPAGALFTDIRNSIDFSDSNTIIYGHHMRNNTMFHNLFNFENKETLYQDPYFTIATPNMNYRYRIFSVRYVNDTDEVYATSFVDEDSFMNFIEKAIEESIYSTQTTVMASDKIVTLSTCAYEDKNRFIVQGVLIDSKEVSDDEDTSN